MVSSSPLPLQSLTHKADDLLSHTSFTLQGEFIEQTVTVEQGDLVGVYLKPRATGGDIVDDDEI
jgi:hypothetical protein